MTTNTTAAELLELANDWDACAIKDEDDAKISFALREYAAIKAQQPKEVVTYPSVEDTGRYEESLFRFADRIEKGMPYLRNSTTDKFCKDIIDDMREEAIASIRNSQGSLGEALKAERVRNEQQSEMAAADAWLDGGWRNDDPSNLTLGKIMLMTARGSRKHGNVDPELAEIVGRNIQRKAQVGIDKIRAEQRAHRPREID